MKKLLSFRILLFVFFVMSMSANPTPSYADAWAEQRSVCNWFRDRFAAYVRLKDCPWWGSTWCGGSTYTNCYDVAAECGTCGVPSYACAYAGFTYGLSSNHEGINGICTGYDTRNFIPRFSLFPMVEGDNSGTKEVKLKVGKTTFDYANHTIILEDITGTLSIKDALDKANIFASFTIAISYDAENKGEMMTNLDDKTYQNRLLWSSKAILNNGLIKDDRRL